MFTLLAGCGDDAAEDTPDAGDKQECPASGEPAVAFCPCKRPAGDYCCGVGNGMTCGDDKVWTPFSDSPCHPNDEDAGVPLIECRR